MVCTDASPRHGPKFKMVEMVLEIDRTVCTKLMLPVHRTDWERATQPYFGVVCECVCVWGGGVTSFHQDN